MVTLRVSDKGIGHEFFRDDVLTIASRLLGCSVLVLNKMRVARGGGVVEFSR